MPLAVGLTGADYRKPSVLHGGFQAAMVICAVLLALGAVLSAIMIDNNVLRPKADQEARRPECRTYCPVGAPPLEPRDAARPAIEAH
jgi:hypothetical protein